MLELFIALLLPVMGPLGASERAGADTVVVCPEPFLAAFRPWLQHRRAQGHRFRVVSETSSREAIRDAIGREALRGNLQYVVLVGDVPHTLMSTQQRSLTVPTFHEKALVNVQWGSEEHLATDNGYADVDGDGSPDVAVGRLTADSVGELRTIVQKILTYENDRRPGKWRRRISFVAGVGGFSPLVDKVLEMATRTFLVDGIDPSYQMTMTYGSWRSPYCPDPRRFHATTVGRLNEGCLFWVYMGHGQRRYLDQIRVPGKFYPIFSTADVHKLRCTQGAPIAVMLSCYTGAFDEPKDCMAEEMLRAPGGPVAVFCGSRVTMPYAMAVLGDNLLSEFSTHQHATLGTLLLHVKQGMLRADDVRRRRQLLDAVAALISPNPDDLAAERAEHILLFNLIGDPLLRLPNPKLVDLKVNAKVTTGDVLVVEGKTPIGGRCTLELVCRRDLYTFKPPARPVYEPNHVTLKAFDEIYHRANNRTWTTQTLDVKAGKFRAQIVIPSEAHGACFMRAYVEGSKSFALGATNVYVRKTPKRIASSQ